MRTLALSALFLVGCNAARTPNIDVDVSFNEPAVSTFEKVANATGVGGFVDNKIKNGVAEAKRTIVIPALEGALADLKGEVKNSPVQETTGNAVPVAVEAKPNPRVRVLFFSGPGCAPCAVLKNRITADLVPLGWTFSDSPASDIQYCDLDTEDGRAMGAIVGLKDGDALPALFVVEPDGRPLARSAGACTAKELGRWLNEWRDRKEQRSVLVKPQAKAFCPNPYCQCANCTCNPCRCGVYASPMPAMGCSTCGVSYRRGWRR